MLSKTASKIFRLLRKSKDGELMFDEIRSLVRERRGELMSACKSLVAQGYAEWSDTPPRNGTYLILTDKGRHYFVYRINAVSDFLVKSIIVPIVVTLLTLWLNAHFSELIAAIRRLL